MSSPSKTMARVVVAGIIITGILPIAWYWAMIGRAESVSTREAKFELNRPGAGIALLDIREPAVFAAKHLEGAENWPYAEIMALASADRLPEKYKGKTLYLLCDSGIRSALATEKLQDLGVPKVFNVRGGMQAWMSASDGLCPFKFCKLVGAAGPPESLPSRDSSRFEQVMMCAAAFGLKPLYMLFSAVLINIIRKQKAPDLAALRLALISFLVGEAFCALNYLGFQEGSYLMEYLHSFGMVLAFGFTTDAVFVGFDSRIMQLSDPEKRCAALGLCGHCVKYSDVPCQFRRLLLLLAAVGFILCFMPLTAVPLDLSYNTFIFNTLYTYTHPVIHQLYEIRLIPVLALIFFAAGLAVLWLKQSDPLPWSEALVSAGAGLLGFSLFRLVLLHAYSENLVWFNAWEEITEFIYVAGVGVVLFIFRERLFREKEVESSSEPPRLIAERGQS